MAVVTVSSISSSSYGTRDSPVIIENKNGQNTKHLPYGTKNSKVFSSSNPPYTIFYRTFCENSISGLSLIQSKFQRLLGLRNRLADTSTGAVCAFSSVTAAFSTTGAAYAALFDSFFATPCGFLVGNNKMYRHITLHFSPQAYFLHYLSDKLSMVPYTILYFPTPFCTKLIQVWHISIATFF